MVDQLSERRVDDGAAMGLRAVRAWFEGPWNTVNLLRTVAACVSFSLFSLALLVTPVRQR